MRRLREIYDDYKAEQWHGDKGTAHSYILIYENLLDRFRNNSTVLEIGVYAGLSLGMWKEYFINSKIYGVDITDEFLDPKFKNDQDLNIIISDSTDPGIFQKLGYSTFDVIIDDGGHDPEIQIKTFQLFKRWMNPNGIYIIEDIVDIDKNYQTFKNLKPYSKIIDNRRVKGRHDDVLAIYNF